MAFIEAARPFEELVGRLGGVERRLAHRAVVLGLEARFGARGDDDAWREFSQLHNLLSFANRYFFRSQSGLFENFGAKLCCLCLWVEGHHKGKAQPLQLLGSGT